MQSVIDNSDMHLIWMETRAPYTKWKLENHVVTFSSHQSKSHVRVGGSYYLKITLEIWIKKKVDCD